MSKFDRRRQTVLHLLQESVDGEYALELAKRAGFDQWWNWGAIYSILARLEDDGLVASGWREQEWGQRRRIYRAVQ